MRMEAEWVLSAPQQYWADKAQPYAFVPVLAFAEAFECSEAGRQSAAALAQPYTPPGKAPLDALVRTKCALPTISAFRFIGHVCMSHLRVHVSPACLACVPGFWFCKQLT
jgi:hypothetical protein